METPYIQNPRTSKTIQYIFFWDTNNFLSNYKKQVIDKNKIQDSDWRRMCCDDLDFTES